MLLCEFEGVFEARYHDTFSPSNRLARRLTGAEEMHLTSGRARVYSQVQVDAPSIIHSDLPDLVGSGVAPTASAATAGEAIDLPWNSLSRVAIEYRFCV